MSPTGIAPRITSLAVCPAAGGTYLATGFGGGATQPATSSTAAIPGIERRPRPAVANGDTALPPMRQARSPSERSHSLGGGHGQAGSGVTYLRGICNDRAIATAQGSYFQVPPSIFTITRAR